jgi:hypothetical protein
MVNQVTANAGMGFASQRERELEFGANPIRAGNETAVTAGKPVDATKVTDARSTGSPERPLGASGDVRDGTSRAVNIDPSILIRGSRSRLRYHGTLTSPEPAEPRL